VSLLTSDVEVIHYTGYMNVCIQQYRVRSNGRKHNDIIHTFLMYFQNRYIDTRKEENKVQPSQLNQLLFETCLLNDSIRRKAHSFFILISPFADAVLMTSHCAFDAKLIFDGTAICNASQVLVNAS
jgi:hypothetical protein